MCTDTTGGEGDEERQAVRLKQSTKIRQDSRGVKMEETNSESGSQSFLSFQPAFMDITSGRASLRLITPVPFFSLDRFKLFFSASFFPLNYSPLCVNPPPPNFPFISEYFLLLSVLCFVFLAIFFFFSLSVSQGLFLFLITCAADCMRHTKVMNL